MRDNPGTEILVGQGIFVYNLWQASWIIQDRGEEKQTGKPNLERGAPVSRDFQTFSGGASYGLENLFSQLDEVPSL